MSQITREGAERIVEFAYELARKEGRKRSLRYTKQTSLSQRLVYSLKLHVKLVSVTQISNQLK